MQEIHGSDRYDAPPPVLTIGSFDGVHRGHRALIEEAVRRGPPSVVYTFEPPPRRVLQPQSAPPRIDTPAERARHLARLGVDTLVVERFDRDLAAQPASWFVEEVLGRRLRAHTIVVGHDFGFGRGRSGNAQTLRDAGFAVVEVPPVQVDGKTVSSSAIREAVARGEVAWAARMLERPYRLRGTVVSGDQRGRTIGFPTANLHLESELVPAGGVYAVRVGDTPAVANLGFRPTFQGERFQVEVHLLGVNEDLYGQTLEVDFVERIRAERRFDGIEALVAQIRADVGAAEAILAR